MTATLSPADAKLRRKQSKVPPSERQLAYLRHLGHTEPVVSMAEASGLIARLTAERRTAHRQQRERMVP